ncbi:MAG: tRNA-dihydrouridine synthase family protein [Acidobacteriota bacterium]
MTPRERFRELLSGQVVLAPLTRGGNLPFRRLCVEMGARITYSEMIDARRLVRGLSRERAMLRRHASEPCFGVQIAARDPELALKAAAKVQEAGADFIDVNMGCPIVAFTRKGLGAALLEKPRRIERLLTALRAELDIPLLAKIRIGYKEHVINALPIAKLIADCGVDALAVHGRTRGQRYRRPADWDTIAEVAEAVDVPVIGNGDLLHPSDARRRLDESGCAALMLARGALVAPWFWQDLGSDDRARSGAERMTLARRWVELATEHWGDDAHGWSRTLEFLRFHLEFWRRYVPVGHESDGVSSLQGRPDFAPRDADEELFWAEGDEALQRMVEEVVAPFEVPAEALESKKPAPDTTAGGWK